MNKLKKVAFIGTVTTGTIAHFVAQSVADGIAKTEGIILHKLDPSQSASFYTGARKEVTNQMQAKVKEKYETIRQQSLAKRSKIIFS